MKKCAREPIDRTRGRRRGRQEVPEDRALKQQQKVMSKRGWREVKVKWSWREVEHKGTESRSRHSCRGWCRLASRSGEERLKREKKYQFQNFRIYYRVVIFVRHFPWAKWGRKSDVRHEAKFVLLSLIRRFFWVRSSPCPKEGPSIFCCLVFWETRKERQKDPFICRTD